MVDNNLQLDLYKNIELIHIWFQKKRVTKNKLYNSRDRQLELSEIK